MFHTKICAFTVINCVTSQNTTKLEQLPSFKILQLQLKSCDPSLTNIHCAFICLSCEGVSKKAGAQTGPGFLPAETSPTPHQIPAAAEGLTENDVPSQTYT